jgi:tetratricopeptide (TPR) repeat protein
MPNLDFEQSQTQSQPLEQAKIDTIKQQCQSGYQLYDLGDYKGALRLFYQAWLLLPKPQSDYEPAGWVLTAIGDTYYKLQQYQQAVEALSSAAHCSGIDNNPFINLRLGQAYLDLEALGKARNQLFRAWSKGGQPLFKQEDPRYFKAIEDLVGA